MEPTMTMKYALPAIALATLAMPALAADVEFYVVQNIATNKCSVMEQKLSRYPSAFLPTDANTKLIGTASYKTQAEAETSMKADKVCAAK
jgi:hypothetical protein